MREMSYDTWLAAIQAARSKSAEGVIRMEVVSAQVSESATRLEVGVVPIDPRAHTQELLDEPGEYWAHDEALNWTADILQADRPTPRAPISLWLAITTPKEGHALYAGDELLLSPPDFLIALQKKINARLEGDPALVSQELSSLSDTLQERSAKVAPARPLGEDPGNARRYATRPTFRPSQAAAIAASALPISFVWGPPGTGKTYTLGHIVAQSVARVAPEPPKRVLVLTIANRAVERVLLSADDAYQELTGCTAPEALLLRTQVPTLDEVRARYHLTAWERLKAKLNETLEGYRQQRRQLMSDHRGSRSEQLIERLAQLKQREDAARQEYRESRTRLIDHAGAIFCTLNQLAWSPDLHSARYDLVILEEASMIPMLYAMDLFESLPQSRFVIAGDPYQLSPVSEIDEDVYPEWFRSVFEHFKLTDLSLAPISSEQRPDSPVSMLNFLDIQSRMPPSLGEALSESFYRSRLRSDPRVGAPPSIDRWGEDALLWVTPRVALQIAEESGLARERGEARNTCHNSARAAISLAREVIGAGLEVNVITPFANQERLLKSYARAAQLVNLPCLTIHKAQGSEADVVIFCLVDPAGWFLRESDSARELCVVASSRARHRLVLIGDRQAALQNPHLRALATRAVAW
jgi:DNA replication ATP-dependent helicase Dna2